MNIYKPMLANSIERPFDSTDWIFEVKWDGIRAIAYIGETLSLKSRNDKELINNFPELKELTILTSNAALDGEIIVMRDGHPDFQEAVRRNQLTNPLEINEAQRKMPATYVIFDILEKDGVSLIDEPLKRRLEILNSAVKQGQYVTISIPVHEHGIQYYETVIRRDLEGVMAKRLSSVYQPDTRSSDWLKIKRVKSCDCVIFGYTPGEGIREETFGALLLGLYDEGKPFYIGRVGTGLTDLNLRQLRQKLDELKVSKAWFTDADIPTSSTWVKPKIVAEVGYQEVSRDLRLRAPRFLGLRDDKPPELCSIIQIKPQKLDEYYAKRDFTLSPEPTGGYTKGQGNSFVIQEHHSRLTHWDLRLERDGVLVSWAVPKGVPTATTEKHLAIQVEDHPLEYGGFEGIIPKGQYGAGKVEIWDRGFYIPVKWGKDKIEIVFAGERIKGIYELILTNIEKNEWLLFKKS
jgi:DNA ligase D-like protein (predicted ligase)/DNA ligase D-like protein (predicted 3'-phosphoesterase)